MAQYPPSNPGGPAYPPQPWQPGAGGPGPTPTGEFGMGPGTAPGRNLNRAPQMQLPPGYEGTSFMASHQIMPPKMPPPPMGDPPPLPNTDLAKLDEAGCRDAMIQHVNEHCCYGSKPAKEMKITNMKGVTALHLTMETFSEGRKTKNKHEPYKGGLVDGPENGYPPGPWDMNVPPREMFADHKIKKEVPHTATVKPCWECDRRGWNTCWRCHGHGMVRCSSCGADGRVLRHRPDGSSFQDICHSCHGSGRRRCHTCGGDGRITCDECKGYRDLRCFIQLVCSFLNHNDDFVLETTDMPDELVATVGGTVLFQDVQPLVRPIVSYPVNDINANSQRLVNDHNGKWPSERCLKQRQTLRGVPVTEVDYTWDDVTTRYWVYGNERMVYAPDYPSQCCCGCSII